VRKEKYLTASSDTVSSWTNSMWYLKHGTHRMKSYSYGNK